MIRLRFPAHLDARCPQSWFGHFPHRLGNLVKPDALSPVIRFHRSVLVLTDQRLALGWTITARSGMQLQPAVFIPHHPIVRSEERRVGKECRSRWSTYQ